VRLKDGTSAAGKRIRIAFHPLEERFEVANPAIRKDSGWIADVATIFAPGARLLQITKASMRPTCG
jgi:hypothetical protein